MFIAVYTRRQIFNINNAILIFENKTFIREVIKLRKNKVNLRIILVSLIQTGVGGQVTGSLLYVFLTLLRQPRYLFFLAMLKTWSRSWRTPSAPVSWLASLPS
jgi:hypothetical protein